MERKFYFAYFQGIHLLGFVVVGMGYFHFLCFYLKKGFVCNMKETVIRFGLWQVAVVAMFEVVVDYVKVSWLYKARVLVFVFQKQPFGDVLQNRYHKDF